MRKGSGVCVQGRYVRCVYAAVLSVSRKVRIRVGVLLDRRQICLGAGKRQSGGGFRGAVFGGEAEGA